MRYFLVLILTLIFALNLQGQNPGGITESPILWLKADQGVTVVGGKVSQWQDQSPYGHSSIQNNTARRPTFSANGPNNQPSLTFDGGDYLKIASGILGDSVHPEMQIFIVSSPSTKGQNYILSENCNPQLLRLSLPYSVGWKYEETVFFDAGESSGAGRVYGYWAGEYGAFNVWSLRTSASESNQSITKDMLPLSSDNSATTLTGTNQQMFVGGNGSSSQNFKGDISEVIVFDAALTLIDQEAVEQYLYEKYGIGPAWVNDQYNYQSSYKRDIVGIGQEDSFAFLADSVQSDHMIIYNPDNLEDNESLTFGHDGQNIIDLSTESLPSGFSQRIKREWRFSEVGDVGNVDINIDLVGIADWPVGSFALLVDDNKNFGDAAVYPLTRGAGTSFDASGINLEDGQYVTVAIQNPYPLNYPLTSLDNFTLVGGTPSHHYLYPTWPNVEEWVYWSRTGPNHWNVTEKVNFRIKFPPNYDPNNAEGYPMVVYFTGCGGMGKFKCNYALLPSDPRYDNNHHAVGLHDIAMNKPAADTTSFPGIVLIPQGDYEGWEGGINNPNPSATMVGVFNMMEAALDHWNINRNQVYIHGLSNGGKAVWDFANRRPDLIAAALPMSATAGSQQFATIGHLPVWHFQGENDVNPPASASRSLSQYWTSQGGDLLYTEYPNTGHNTWAPAYIEADFYSYMRRQDQRNAHVFYGEKDIPTAGGSVKMGIAPGNEAYEWYRNDTLIVGAVSHQYTAAYAGTYKVKWQRYNGDWETSFDIVLTGPVPSNSPPTADAGMDQTIHLPTNSVALLGSGNDTDGTIINYNWTQISGPSTANFSSPQSASTNALALIEGTYVFRFTVSDDENEMGADDLVVIVNPQATGESEAIFRLNVGGTSISSTPLDWDLDKRSSDHQHFTGNSLSTSWNGCGIFDDSNNTTGAPSEIFCTYRIEPSWGAISYTFPVANGSYELNLYFAERAYAFDGLRVFDVNVENQTILPAFDIHAEVGMNEAVKKTFVVNVLDGNLDIDLTRITGDPVLNGLEIKTMREGTPNSPPVVNAGGDQNITLPINTVSLAATASDSDGTISSYLWTQISGPNTVILNPNNEAVTTAVALVEGVYVFQVIVSDDGNATATDQIQVTVNPEPVGTGVVIYRTNVGGGSLSDSPMDWSIDKKNAPSPYLMTNVHTSTGWNHNNTNNPTDAPNILLGTQRYQPSWGGQIEYEFPVNNGTHDVKLYFAEKPGNNTNVGDRLFSIEIEGNQVLANYDVTAANGDGGDQKNYQVVITDGTVNLALVSQVGFPILSGIEIVSYVGAPPPPTSIEIDGESQSLRLYPNPVKEQLTLEFAVGLDDREVEVKIYDQFMREVLVSTRAISPGHGKDQVSLSNKHLSSGLYLVIVNTATYPRQIGRVVKE